MYILRTLLFFIAFTYITPTIYAETVNANTQSKEEEEDLPSVKRKKARERNKKVAEDRKNKSSHDITQELYSAELTPESELRVKSKMGVANPVKPNNRIINKNYEKYYNKFFVASPHSIDFGLNLFGATYTQDMLVKNTYNNDIIYQNSLSNSSTIGFTVAYLYSITNNFRLGPTFELELSSHKIESPDFKSFDKDIKAPISASGKLGVKPSLYVQFEYDILTFFEKKWRIFVNAGAGISVSTATARITQHATAAQEEEEKEDVDFEEPAGSIIYLPRLDETTQDIAVQMMCENEAPINGYTEFTYDRDDSISTDYALDLDKKTMTIFAKFTCYGYNGEDIDALEEQDAVSYSKTIVKVSMPFYAGLGTSYDIDDHFKAVLKVNYNNSIFISGTSLADELIAKVDYSVKSNPYVRTQFLIRYVF